MLSKNRTKMNPDERKFELKAKTKSVGLLDPRMFTGESKLVAYQLSDSLWALKYEHGRLPEPLCQRFTSFNKLVQFVELYFHKKNVVVKEVSDA